MGDPKFSRRKYEGPIHPWQGSRIKIENELLKKYGLKNKRELWKSQSLIRELRRQARILQAKLRFKDLQAEKETKQLLDRLSRLGFLPDGASLNDILALDVEKILIRRLQTMVYLKGLAYTPKQARQLIVHGHIIVNDRKVTIPGYLVKRHEETTISYSPYSAFSSELHPSRPHPEYVEMAARAATMAPEEGEGKVDIMGRMRLAKKSMTLGEEPTIPKKIEKEKAEDTSESKEAKEELPKDKEQKQDVKTEEKEDKEGSESEEPKEEQPKDREQKEEMKAEEKEGEEGDEK